MNHLNPGKTGLTLAYFIAGVHFLWVLAIALGWAGSMVDFIFRVHMLSVPVTVLPFDILSAVELLIITAAVGYLVGYAFARVWNWTHK
ncbi:MAG TPA: hypothetical protein VFK72_10105 [Nevskia sp.]|nr:hypothetical protein [Nevskia sp.]